jgi:hypothetical protein
METPKHILKVAMEIRMPDSNEKVVVIQEKVELLSEFSLKVEPFIYETTLNSIKNLMSIKQKGPARFEKGHITYWTKFDPEDIHGTYHTIPARYDPRKELEPVRQNGPNGPGTYSVQYVVYLYNSTYNGDPIEHIDRPPFELLN